MPWPARAAAMAGLICPRNLGPFESRSSRPDRVRMPTAAVASGTSTNVPASAMWPLRNRTSSCFTSPSPILDNDIKNENRVTSADLLLHPVRLRILQTFLGDRTLTTSDLQAELPDVPPASLYRHVARLVGAGVLVVVDERRGPGAPPR